MEPGNGKARSPASPKVRGFGGGAGICVFVEHQIPLKLKRTSPSLFTGAKTRKKKKGVVGGVGGGGGGGGRPGGRYGPL